MNAAAPTPESIETVVANAYPARKRSGDPGLEQDKARRTLSLGQFLKPFVSLGAGFLAAVWRAIVNALRKMAAAFNVDVDVPASLPERGSGAAVATLSGQDSSAASEQQVEAAATGSARDLAILVSQLTKAMPDKDKLKAEGGPALAAMQMQALGSALSDTQAEAAALDRQLEEACAQVATSCGATAQSVRSLLDSGGLEAEPALAASFTAPTLELARRHTEIKEQREALRLQFCSYAIEALRVAREGGLSDLAAVSKAKVDQFADQEMISLILSEAPPPKTEDVTEIAADCSSPQLQSQKPIAGDAPDSAAPQLPDSLPASVGSTAVRSTRRSRVGMSAGVVDDAEEDEDPPGRFAVERSR